MEPGWAEVTRRALENRLHDLHVALPGQVVVYVPATQTADVLPMVRRVVARDDPREDPIKEDLPIIRGVPVQFSSGGALQFSIHFPLIPGDTGMLLFSEASFAQWRATGKLSDPGDLRRHGISYPVFIPGVRPSTKPIPGASATAATMGNASPSPSLIEFGATDLKLGRSATDFVALASLVEARLTAIEAILNGHVHTGVTTGPGSSGPLATPLVPGGPVTATVVKAQ